MKHLETQMSILRNTSAIALMIAMGGTMAHAETKPAAKDIVIVHGALVDGLRETYAADVPAPEAQFMADSEQQLAEKALGASVSAAAWRTKPSYAILTTQDHVISPQLQRWMYQRSGAKVTEVGASHAVFVSQPDAVARVIEAAAKAGE
jgi:pimeloyl-ACP methyl ester carboxylesterase